jgi:hypothetical protein
MADKESLAYGVTAEEFYRDFRDVANLSGDRPIVRQIKHNTGLIDEIASLEGERPLVRQTHTNTADIASLKFRYYVVLASIIGGVGLTQLSKLLDLVP